MKIQLDVVDSTNSWAKRNLIFFPKNETIAIRANQQTAGKGTFGKSWISPPENNLYLSIVKKAHPSLKTSDYSQACALGISQYLIECGIKPTIKWPNDRLVIGKKICGILIETTTNQKDLYIIIGIGLNCHLTPESRALISQEATCLFEELNRPVHVSKVEEEVLFHIEKSISSFIENSKAMHEKYTQEISWMIGRDVSYKKLGLQYQSKILAIEKNGALLIEEETGKQKIISSPLNWDLEELSLSYIPQKY